MQDEKQAGERVGVATAPRLHLHRAATPTVWVDAGNLIGIFIMGRYHLRQEILWVGSLIKGSVCG